MGIDRFYEIAGTSIKRVWYRFIGRPLKNVNVEARAYKQIEKKEPAPWHEATKNVIQAHKKELSSSFKQTDSFNPTLADRLKQVKVSEQQRPVEPIETSEIDSKDNHPKERFGFELPYVFLKPETVPLNKIAVLDLLELLVLKSKENTSNEELATIFRLQIEDVDNIVKYVSVYHAFDPKTNKEITMFQKSEEAYDMLTPGNDEFEKQIVDK